MPSFDHLQLSPNAKRCIKKCTPNKLWFTDLDRDCAHNLILVNCQEFHIWHIWILEGAASAVKEDWRRAKRGQGRSRTGATPGWTEHSHVCKPAPVYFVSCTTACAKIWTNLQQCARVCKSVEFAQKALHQLHCMCTSASTTMCISAPQLHSSARSSLNQSFPNTESKADDVCDFKSANKVHVCLQNVR